MDDCTINKALCDARHDKIYERFAAMDKALTLYSTELNRRLDALNELRSEVVKDREIYLKRETFEVKTSMYDAWIREASEKLTILMTQYGNRITISVGVALVSMVISLAMLVVVLVR